MTNLNKNLTITDQGRLFLDLDGVMADFEAHFLDVFRVRHDSMSDKEMWNLIDSRPDFFFDVPLMPDAKRLLSVIDEHFPPQDIFILTACPKHDYRNAALNKKRWVDLHLGDRMVLPMTGGVNKTLFMRKPGDVLIDDYKKNILPWIDDGGYGIVHKTYDNTVEQLGIYFSLIEYNYYRSG